MGRIPECIAKPVYDIHISFSPFPISPGVFLFENIVEVELENAALARSRADFSMWTPRGAGGPWKSAARSYFIAYINCVVLWDHTHNDLEVWSQYLCLCLHHTVHGPHHGPVVRVSARLGACF